MSAKERPLPCDTQNVLEDFGVPSNFGLAFHRYPAHPDTNPQHWTGTETEEEMWKDLAGQAHKIFARSRDDSAPDRTTQAALDQQHARYDRILEMRRQRWEPGSGRKLGRKVAWRLLIGLSAPSVLNNGITLHPLFGFPYLPASGLKGLLRHFRLTEIAEEVGVRPLSAGRLAEREKERTPWQQLDDLLLMPDPETDEERERIEKNFERLREDMEAVVERLREERRSEDSEYEAEALTGVTCGLDPLREHAEAYRRAFGSPDQRGRVNFFDVLPGKLMVDGQSLLERDIVTPHNREYHTEGEPPADYHDPVPVQMLAVRRGATFVFRMTCPDSDLLAEVRGWLERAVAFWGTGAKTRSGYGELIAQDPDAA
jgi:CRISPR-associated protein Cmr6